MLQTTISLSMTLPELSPEKLADIQAILHNSLIMPFDPPSWKINIRLGNPSPEAA